MTDATRSILLVLHPRRSEARVLAQGVITRFHDAGVVSVLDEATIAELDPPIRRIVAAADPADPARGCELVCALGGDGTILRAAEVSRGSSVPLLGINLGHVGFLAESEREDLDETIVRILARDYHVEDRMTLDVVVHHNGVPLARTWALNEAAVEKAARERMLDLTVSIDGRPLSTWGCDGVVMATPTGSTAYAFSAGGPVVWPDVEAILLVPISAHALFARPVVLSPASHLAVDIVAGTEGAGVLWCDGRRAIDLPPGARIEVARADMPVRLARLSRDPFTDRLVEKFNLSIEGWRGNGRANPPSAP